ncbi:MAG: exodeoxyribonuclease VII large subunit [Bacteroidales bacterium]
MPEIIHNQKVFSLLEITQSLQRAVKQWYRNAYWIKAEMNKLNHYSQSGHCYPDLVERREGRVVAQIRANLWADDFNRINEQFIRILKEPLKDGISILILAKLSFHPVYGMSLIIQDIDPSYTLGDLEREKQETIDRLKAEGIYAGNKALRLPLLPQRIAIISVETSRGFADFKSVIENNPWGYRFFYMLFPALLQGDNAVASVIAQLKRITRVLRHFDLVAIIRGGGGEVGLSCYNHYDLAREIASFPLPVLTGIGHSTNETVSEMVAWKNAITPTELADLLIGRFRAFDEPLERSAQSIRANTRALLKDQQNQLLQLSKGFRSGSLSLLAAEKTVFSHSIRDFHQGVMTRMIREQSAVKQLEELVRKLPESFLRAEKKAVLQNQVLLKKAAASTLKTNLLALGALEKQVSLLHPQHVLRRGYSITLKNDRSLTGTESVQPGDIMETILYHGKIISTVKSKTNENEQ